MVLTSLYDPHRECNRKNSPETCIPLGYLAKLNASCEPGFVFNENKTLNEITPWYELECNENGEYKPINPKASFLPKCVGEYSH